MIRPAPAHEFDGPARAIDEGLLSPVTVGLDGGLSDAAVLDALVTAEVALTRAWAFDGAHDEAEAVARALGWSGRGIPCRDHDIDVRAVAAAAVAGGNPVIPLVGELRARVPEGTREWVHRGATSQDILDSALMFLAHGVVDRLERTLDDLEHSLVAFMERHRDLVAAARTLTQHAVPTTLGARCAGWLRGVRAAQRRLLGLELPVQLGGAGGTLASFVELADADGARGLVEAFADELGLSAPNAPWHTARWPVTELGDALVQVIDAVGKLATDVATLSRTEIGELAEGSGGGSSAMPQKQNPTESVLIRSAALRAPQLGATLHLASAFAADERPDGAWHAEWPTLRELLRLALGATAHACDLVGGLRVDREAVARNLSSTGGLIMAERVSIVLGPLIGRSGVSKLIAAAARGGDLASVLRSLPEAAGIDLEALLDPASYTGLATEFVDQEAWTVEYSTPSPRTEEPQ